MTIDSREAVRRGNRKYQLKNREKINSRKRWITMQKKKRRIEKGLFWEDLK